MCHAHSPHGVCFCRVLIQGSVSDEWGVGTTLARTVNIPGATPNSSFLLYVETLKLLQTSKYEFGYVLKFRRV